MATEKNDKVRPHLRVEFVLHDHGWDDRCTEYSVIAFLNDLQDTNGNTIPVEELLDKQITVSRVTVNKGD